MMSSVTKLFYLLDKFKKLNNLIFEGLAALTVKIAIVQHMPISSFIDSFQRLEGNYLFLLGRFSQQILPKSWYLLIKILVLPPRSMFREQGYYCMYFHV
jgi:hypothetical protein